MIVKLYRRLASYARTINKFNRIRIAIENILTPLELQALSAAELEHLSANLRSGRTPGINAPIPAASRHVTEDAQLERQLRRGMAVSHMEWCEGLNRMCAQSNKAAPEAFVRLRLAPNMLLFSGSGDTSQKTLIFCFSGTTQRMMLPTPVFLQNMDARRVDVVLLCDNSKNLYRNGASGIEGDMPSLFDLIDSKIDRAAYRRAVALGTSAGGLPAILCALRLGLEKVLCVGGSDPHDERFVNVGGVGVGTAKLLQQYAAQLNKPLPEILALYSADYPVDEASAKSIAATISAFSTPGLMAFQPRSETVVGHTLFPAILEAGELSRLFDAALLGDNSSTLLRDWAVEAI